MYSCYCFITELGEIINNNKELTMYWIIYCGKNEAICLVCHTLDSLIDNYTELVESGIEILETSEN